jgi:aspartate carbamoyltransferase catalytic subunit
LLGGQAYHTEDASQFFPVHSSRFVDDITSILASLKMDVVVVRSGAPNVTERAASVNAMHVVNGGSVDDHPTQALADLYTIQRELGGVDGRTVAIVGRLEHRNVSALLRGLALFNNVEVVLVPFSGQATPDVVEHCMERGLRFSTSDSLDALAHVDAIYLNGPRTSAHMELLRQRGRGRLVIDSKFMNSLQPHTIIMDPMQRSGDFMIDVSDSRLAFYRQAENALYVRMGILSEMFQP